VRAFLAAQYQEDYQVKFKQVELQNKLLDLFIDLPFRVVINNPRDVGLTRAQAASCSVPMRVRMHEDPDAYILTSSDNESVSGTATLLLSDFGRTELKQVVIEGAPGQGKSTLAQYLCQVHRLRLLNKTDELASVPKQDKESALLLPFKVDLRDVATWLNGADPFALPGQARSPSDPRTVETFLARLVRHHSGGIDFDVNDLIEVSKLMSLLIVLDGLDEVVDIKQRSDVIAAVTKSISRLRENCRDIMFVITSRPAAFANSPGFAPEVFPHIELLSVNRSQINLYATRWMDARGLAPKERAEFEEILNEKMNAPHLKDLARNPMQLTILLSLILTQGSALPDKRTSLYDEYVNLFFSRESAKSPAVRKNIDLLKDLHCYLGWVLHSSAETSKRRSNGRIAADELRTLLESYLKSEQHKTDIVDEIFGAMLERVVMIVSRIQGTYEFEVQPLREYFAARYLYDTASYSPPGKERKGTKPDRFDAIARDFYWLNVARFYCGCFSKGELLDLADRVKELISDPLLGKSRHPVSLAAMLLSDWVFAQSPKAVTDLVPALTSRDALRRLAPSIVGRARERVLQIPSQCGGEEVSNAAFALLQDSKTGPDERFQLALIVRSQGTELEIEKRWLDSPLASDDSARWLEVGGCLGSLERANKEAIAQRIRTPSASNRRITTILCNYGRYDCVLTSQHNASLVSHLYLDRQIHPNELGTSPFFLIPLLVTSFPFNKYENPYLYEAISNFRSLKDSKREPAFDLHTDFFSQCFEMSTKIANAAMHDFSPKIWGTLID
jgi:hypothetical protein